MDGMCTRVQVNLLRSIQLTSLFCEIFISMFFFSKSTWYWEVMFSNLYQYERGQKDKLQSSLDSRWTTQDHQTFINYCI